MAMKKRPTSISFISGTTGVTFNKKQLAKRLSGSRDIFV
jgi:hypothetical protein